jgi:hypothetical protein
MEPPCSLAWWLGPAASILLGTGLFFAAPSLRQVLPYPWGDLLLIPAVVGQAVFFGLLVALLLDGLKLARCATEVRGLTLEQRAGWAGRAWQAALGGPEDRSTPEERQPLVKEVKEEMRRPLAWRGRFSFLVACVSATSGLWVSLRSLQAAPNAAHEPAFHFLLPLWVGTAETASLALFILAVYVWAGRVLDRWAERVLLLEHSQLTTTPVENQKPVVATSAETAKTEQANGGPATEGTAKPVGGQPGQGPVRRRLTPGPLPASSPPLPPPKPAAGAFEE